MRVPFAMWLLEEAERSFDRDHKEHVGIVGFGVCRLQNPHRKWFSGEELR